MTKYLLRFEVSVRLKPIWMKVDLKFLSPSSWRKKQLRVHFCCDCFDLISLNGRTWTWCASYEKSSDHSVTQKKNIPKN